ncbi:hypothetical protein F0L46_07945 [Salinarimonas soli]|uniref:Uncharacterized protein n=1 Tax=Salinarimonas soli TaxID=1638099 RepID=A0A5B2VG86_9HYPH|nr:hypothetical protein F0L46_07945 [Salinarimonas soli]
MVAEASPGFGAGTIGLAGVFAVSVFAGSLLDASVLSPPVTDGEAAADFGLTAAEGATLFAGSDGGAPAGFDASAPAAGVGAFAPASDERGDAGAGVGAGVPPAGVDGPGAGLSDPAAFSASIAGVAAFGAGAGDPPGADGVALGVVAGEAAGAGVPAPGAAEVASTGLPSTMLAPRP